MSRHSRECRGALVQLLLELSQRDDLGGRLIDHHDGCFNRTYYFEETYIPLLCCWGKDREPGFYVKVGDPDQLYRSAVWSKCDEDLPYGGRYELKRTLTPCRVAELGGEEAIAIFSEVTHLLKQPRREPEPENMWEV